jgi:proteasome accessory factor B
MFELYIMHQAIEHYRGTPLEQRLESFFRRFAGQLDNVERFTLEDLGDVLSFRPSAPEIADAKLFELLTRAVRERRCLSFDYRKPGEKKAECRRVKPYHLFEFGGRWYLHAYDPMRADVRTFVLGRMRDAVATDERFDRPKDFDPRKHLEKSIGVMAGKGDYQVIIQMDAWLTDILRGRRWHPSQVIDELPGGASQLRLRLGSLEEIEQYVLSWGTHATVIGPNILRERVAKVARQLAARYEEKPPA